MGIRQSTASASIRDQRDYYTTRWRDFQYATPLELARLSAVVEFMDRIELQPNPKICDLGCGSGWSTNILGMFGPATGVDLADVSIAQERYPHCEFFSMNVAEWKTPKNEFDLVVSMEVIEHIDWADQGPYLALASRMLKPGGHLLLTTPNKRSMDAIHGGGRSWSSQPLENWLSPRELNALLEQNGFEVEARTSVTLGIASEGLYRIVNSHKLNTFLHAIGLRRLWQKAARRANFGLHLAVLARKK
jgi:2-polyprenyl-3-methyl-5-hydroxy-6-metoxy-1,4-benzoquinol methylase